VPLAAVVALLAAAMLAAAYANPSIDRLPLDGLDAGPSSSPTPVTLAPTEPAAAAAPPEASLAVPAWVGWALSVLCAAVIVVVVGLLVWMLVRDRVVGRADSAPFDAIAPPTPTETGRRVRAVLDEGLADLDEQDADPRRVVIACWVRLEEAAALAGIPRQAGDTSAELVERLLGHSSVSGGVLAPFAAVYREARFATHTVDTQMRDQARASLTRLRDELSVDLS
jgi:hypothetical protein